MEYHTIVIYVLAIFLIIIVLCYSDLCGPILKFEYLTRLNEGGKVTIGKQHNGNPDSPNRSIKITHLEDVRHILSRSRQKDPRLDSHIKPEKEYDVPERLHFIWIGSQLPTKYIKNIETFRTQNKQYEIYLWLDNNSSLQTLQNQSFHVQKIQTSLLINREIYEQEKKLWCQS